MNYSDLCKVRMTVAVIAVLILQQYSVPTGIILSRGNACLPIGNMLAQVEVMN